MKKRRLKLLALFLAASMTVPTTVGYAAEPGAQAVKETGSLTEPSQRKQEETVQVDGILDKWAQDETSIKGTGAVCAVEDGWLHLKSDPTNGNNPKTFPAMFVNPNTFDFSKEGYFEFTMKSNNANTGVNDSDRFGVYLGYNTDQNGMFVGYDNQGWFWQKYMNGDGAWFTGSRHAAPAKGAEVKVRIDWSADHKMSLTLDGKKVFENEDFSGIAGNLKDKIAFKCGSFNNNVTDVLIKDIHYPGQETETITTYTVSGKVKDEDGRAISGADVTIGNVSVKTDKEGNFSADGLKAGTYTVSVSKAGYTQKTETVTVSDADMALNDIVLSSGAKVEYEAPDTISSDAMEVGIDNTFPRVAGYTMKGGDIDGKKFYGQTEALDTIVLNQTDATDSTGTAVKLGKGLTINYKKDGSSKALYTMHVKTENGIDATIESELVVEDRTLAFNITKVTNNKGAKEIVKTINIPNHNLVSVKSTQAGAKLDGANMSTDVAKSGDSHYDVTDSMAAGKSGYMYAFVSGGGLSAGLWSNSENNVTADWQRVAVNVTEKDGHKTAGLSSNYWTYQKGEEYRAENKDYELPSVKIAITGDQNGDGIADWQDGAIAYRDIMNNPVGSELVPDRTAIRVAMNFSSQAQNPFLMTLDNVKKVYLNTDGLGQSVLLKGYGSEGHDSGHLNYADIGKRIGGAEDMKTLLEEGEKYGATFGIHVNASETYPESKYFTEDRLKKSGNGYAYGWNWLDQGINIDADYDLRNGRGERFKDLWKVLGGEENKLDFIYVDVWGNGQSGDNGTWASRQLAKEITQECGWRLAGEWGYANEYDSTFQHWAADLTYGGATLKGINSAITRFIRNHQKDSWVGDYPSYGGAAVNPLLGGYDMKDFEGWQGRNDYKGYIENLFDDNVATKFLQHYKVMKWEDGKPTTVNGAAWTPEMKITLQDDARKNTVVVERQSNDGGSAGYSLRTMTYNGRTIMDGEKYLIPWFWDENGKELKEEKLYHWNQAGGKSTWDLPDGWADAKVYELTEHGKEEVKIASVSGGKITFDAQAKTPYVVYKTEAKNPTDAEMQWSIGTHLVDTGFNSKDPLTNWEITGKGAEIVKSAGNNSMLKIENKEGETTLTQTMTGLEAGKQYVAMVGVDNRSDAKASMEIKSGDKVLGSNYTKRSIAKNYSQADAHNTNAATIAGQGSYFQNMYVFFTAPENGKADLVLKREAGEGAVYYDDLRVVQNDSDNFKDDGTFVQNFEDVPQGIWPFVIGGAEGVTDNRTHLSEKHAPYTQAGWYTKKLDDVLEGTWSLKTNGLTQRNGLIYQTIPQNYRFESGMTYNVSFDYELGSEGAYELVVGDGEGNITQTYALECAIKGGKKAEKSNIKIRLTGAESGQSWIGIRSTQTAPDLQGTGGGDADFGGYKDFILDNLTIQKSNAQKGKLEQLAKENSGRYEANYSAKTWKTFTEAMENAQKVLDNFEASQAEVDKAYDTLDKAVKGLDIIGITLSGKVTDKNGNAAGDITVSVNMDGKEIYTVTNSRGEYVLPGVLFGKWEVKADSPVFNAQTKAVEASKDKLEQTMDFQLEETLSSVKGLVTEIGRPSEGAKITVSGNGLETAQVAATGKTGAYEFDKLPAGTYSLKVEKEGYDVYTAEVTVTKDKPLVKNIMLSPLSTVDYENDYEKNETAWDNLAGNTSSTTIKHENGAYKISFPGGGHANVYETKAPKFKNGMVEADITPEKDGTRIGLLLRANDMDNRVYVGVGDQKNQWFAEHWGKGGNTWTGMYSGPSADAGKTLHLKAEIVDKTVTLWVNDQKIFTVTMDAMPTDAGFLGINTRENHTVTVDNVKVTSYDAPEGNVQHVAGRVEDGRKAVEGAEVTLKGTAVKRSRAGSESEEIIMKTKTDKWGNYKFKNVPEGTYTITVSYGGKAIETAVTVDLRNDYAVAKAVNFGEAAEVNKESLQEAINQADIIEKDAYKTTGWEAFAAALTEAKAVVKDDKASVEDVTLAQIRLTDAMNSLEKQTDKTALSAIVDKAKERKEGDYTPESWASFSKALIEAENVLKNADATKEEVILAGNALLEAAENLQEKAEEPEKPSKDALQKLVDEYRGLKEADYTKESWEAFKNAFAKAESVLAEDEATAEEIAQAEAELKKAKEELVKAEVPAEIDKSALKAVIGRAESLKKSDYTAKSWRAFNKAFVKAKAVYLKPHATQKEIDAAAAGLEQAIDSLVKAEKPGWPGNLFEKAVAVIHTVVRTVEKILKWFF